MGWHVMHLPSSAPMYIPAWSWTAPAGLPLVNWSIVRTHWAWYQPTRSGVNSVSKTSLASRTAFESGGLRSVHTGLPVLALSSGLHLTVTGKLMGTLARPVAPMATWAVASGGLVAFVAHDVFPPRPSRSQESSGSRQ